MSDKPNREAATAFQASGIRLQEALTPEGSTLRYVGGAARGHLGHGVRPCFLTLTLHRFTSVSGGVYSLWDGNSTPARCGCQEVITIYCISKQLLRRCPFDEWVFHSHRLGEHFDVILVASHPKISA
jgi:hypothetical protein